MSAETKPVQVPAVGNNNLHDAPKQVRWLVAVVERLGGLGAVVVAILFLAPFAAGGWVVYRQTRVAEAQVEVAGSLKDAVAAQALATSRVEAAIAAQAQAIQAQAQAMVGLSVSIQAQTEAMHQVSDAVRENNDLTREQSRTLERLALPSPPR